MNPPYWDDADQEDPSGPNVRYSQQNRATRRGSIYANQGPGSMNVNHYKAAQRGVSGWFVIAMVLIDIVYFFYGMTAYSGQNNNADAWRVGIFFFLVFLTGLSLRGWRHRRF